MTTTESRKLTYMLRAKIKDYDSQHQAGTLSTAEYHMRRTPCAVALAYISAELNEPVNLVVAH